MYYSSFIILFLSPPLPQGGLDKYHGVHPLRERAAKLHLGIMVIRFEMPFNIWCGGCNNHIGMGKVTANQNTLF